MKIPDPAIFYAKNDYNIIDAVYVNCHLTVQEIDEKGVMNTVSCYTILI